MRAFKAEHEAVDTFIRSIGGYWAPLGALARVTEELGEFAEAAAANDPTAEIEEITDLFVIVSAIANQYCAWPTPEQLADTEPDEVDLRALVRATGPLARLVNQFEGVKPPKQGERTADITEVIARIYALLDRMAAGRRVSLGEMVLASARVKAARDTGRFAASFDPITAGTLDAFRAAATQPLHAWAASARLWGEPSDVDADTPATLQSLRRRHAERFFRIGTWHRLDGFVGSDDPGASDSENLAIARRKVATWTDHLAGADIAVLAGIFGGRLYTLVRRADGEENTPPAGSLFPVPLEV